MKQHDEGALIYFARGLTSGVWKIGVSYDPATRMVVLVAQRRESFDLRAAIPGTRATEREMHERFGHLRAEGREWFHDDGSIEAFIASLPEERRGSYVYEFRGPRPRITEEERAKRMSKLVMAWVRRYRERHGHPYRSGQTVDGCAECVADIEAAATRKAKRAARLRCRRPTTVLPPSFAVGRHTREWPEVKPS